MTIYLLKVCDGGIGPSDNGDEIGGVEGTLEGVVSMHRDMGVATSLALKKMEDDPQKNSDYADFWYVRTYEVE